MPENYKVKKILANQAELSKNADPKKRLTRLNLTILTTLYDALEEEAETQMLTLPVYIQKILSQRHEKND
jgi:predicted HicB family RNase H-like nuclease